MLYISYISYTTCMQKKMILFQFYFVIYKKTIKFNDPNLDNLTSYLDGNQNIDKLLCHIYIYI